MIVGFLNDFEWATGKAQVLWGSKNDASDRITLWGISLANALLMLACLALIGLLYYMLIAEPKLYARKVEGRFKRRHLKNSGEK